MNELITLYMMLALGGTATIRAVRIRPHIVIRRIELIVKVRSVASTATTHAHRLATIDYRVAIRGIIIVVPCNCSVIV